MSAHNTRPSPLLLATALAVSALLPACNHKQEYQDKISELEREITRLRAERANLKARNGALDDRLVVLAKSADECEKNETRRSLDVVRLAPGNVEPEPRAETEERSAPAPKIRDGEKRPVLTLHERRSSPITAPTLGSASTSTGPAIPPAAGLGADNLGVVPMGAGAGQTNAAASATGPMEQFNAAYRAYTNKEHDRALASFSTFIRQHPDHGYADNAIFWRGECYLAKGNFLGAIGEFERLMARFPRSEKGPSAMYRIGFAYDQLRDQGRAREYYFRVVEKYPGTDAARRASRRVAALDSAGTRSSSLARTAASGRKRP